jgi:hypothetical protein
MSASVAVTAASASAVAASKNAAHPAHPAMGQPPKPRPPAKPIGEATLALHVAGAARIHIWEIGPKGDAGPRLGATLVTDKSLMQRIQEAIGFTQKPKPPEGECKRCASPVRFVFQSPLGMDLGGVDVGCAGDAKGTGRYWQPASTKCGTVKFAKPDELEKLIAEAKEKKPAKYPGQGSLP